MMIKIAIGLIVVLAVLAASGALVIALNRPVAPPPLASISDPFAGVDFSDLPPAQTFAARDGTAIAYHAYPGTADVVAVLIHGSSGFGASMHPLARALNAKGATVYALDMRGHGGSGRRGDIDYIGQLDDDVVDFLDHLGPRAPNERRVLAGFSSGAGFAMRFAGGARRDQFDRYVFISPPLIGTPAVRRGRSAWAGVAVPRIIALGVLNGFGVHAFDDLPTVAFAVAEDAPDAQTRVYSHRLTANFAARRNYALDLQAAPRDAIVLAGQDDELLVPDELARLIHAARPDIEVRILPGLGHVAMTVSPAGLAAIVEAVMRENGAR